MGAIGGLLGIGGGNNYQNPQLAQILNTTTAQQLQNTAGASAGAVRGQQDLLNAIQRQNGLGNQSQVYGQLQGVANGTGPNPAQAMLNQATGQNVAGQAALMAGQRGASANTGLIARQAAQQGAQTQQNAVGQAAALQAQQSLGALGQAGALANQQAANQIGAVGANTQANQAQQQMMLNAAGQQNQANVANQGSVNQGNAALKSQQMQNQAGFIGGLGNAAGGALSLGTSLFATGGPVSAPTGAMSIIGRSMMATGGNVGSSLLQSGGAVPGSAEVAGNSYSNDKVKALLSPGELVVDRETMKDQGKAGQAARFLAAVIAAKKKQK